MGRNNTSVFGEKNYRKKIKLTTVLPVFFVGYE